MRDDQSLAERRELRCEACSGVLAHRADGTSQTVVITDISRQGCQLRTEVPLRVGETVTLKHDVLGSVSAQVRWACAGRAGLLFLR